MAGNDYWPVQGWAEDEMIVSGMHLGDKKAAHVLLSYQAQQPQYNPPPHPLRGPRPSQLTQALGAP